MDTETASGITSHLDCSTLSLLINSSQNEGTSEIHAGSAIQQDKPEQFNIMNIQECSQISTMISSSTDNKNDPTGILRSLLVADHDRICQMTTVVTDDTDTTFKNTMPTFNDYVTISAEETVPRFCPQKKINDVNDHMKSQTARTDRTRKRSLRSRTFQTEMDALPDYENKSKQQCLTRNRDRPSQSLNSDKKCLVLLQPEHSDLVTLYTEDHDACMGEEIVCDQSDKMFSGPSMHENLSLHQSEIHSENKRSLPANNNPEECEAMSNEQTMHIKEEANTSELVYIHDKLAARPLAVKEESNICTPDTHIMKHSKNELPVRVSKRVLIRSKRLKEKATQLTNVEEATKTIKKEPGRQCKQLICVSKIRISFEKIEDQMPESSPNTEDNLQIKSSENDTKQSSEESKYELTSDGRYKCVKCHAIFVKLSSLQHHKECRGEFPCTKCGKVFNQKLCLARHLARQFDCKSRKELNEARHKKVSCPKCNVMVRGASLSYHMQKHENLKCHICQKTFAGSSGLKSHIQNVHEKVRKNECSYCGQKFTNMFGLRFHVRHHIEKSLLNQYELIMRGTNSNDKETNKFSCPICFSEFDYVILWLKHLPVHVHDVDFPESEQNVSETKPEIRINDNDLGNESVRYKISKLLEMHQDGLDIEVDLCDICANVSFTRQEILRHRELHQEPKHRCQYCAKPFKDKTGMISHEQHHTKNYSFVCDICDCGFVSKQSLLGHKVKIHSHIEQGFKRYVCPLCSTVRTSQKQINEHIHVVHEGSKPYQCDQCIKAFGTKYSLKVHQWTHCNEKLFECPVCEKCFADPSNLINHGKKNHPNDSKELFMRRKLAKPVDDPDKDKILIDSNSLILS